MNNILLTLLFLVSTPIFGVDLKKHPIYAQIVRNKPELDKRYAMKVSNSIYRACKEHKVPKRILTAILAQESEYRLGATGKISGLLDGQIATVEVDFGIGQINWRNVRDYKLDPKRLVTDLDYSVNAAAMILKEKMYYRKRDKNWWSRYYSGNREKRRVYTALVERYL